MMNWRVARNSALKDVFVAPWRPARMVMINDGRARIITARRSGPFVRRVEAPPSQTAGGLPVSCGGSEIAVRLDRLWALGLPLGTAGHSVLARPCRLRPWAVARGLTLEAHRVIGSRVPHVGARTVHRRKQDQADVLGLAASSRDHTLATPLKNDRDSTNVQPQSTLVMDGTDVGSPASRVRHNRNVTTIFDQPVGTYLSSICITSDPGDEYGDYDRCWDGQTNGVCGAGVSGFLLLQTGSDTTAVPVRIDYLASPPPLEEQWEDIVEVSFRPLTEDVSIVEGAVNQFWLLPLEVQDYRVRYCAAGMDAARDFPTPPGQDAADRYLLQFWPASPAPDAILREQSRTATHYHQMNTRD